MDILLVSLEDICRSRIAQGLLSSYGRGMRIETAGIAEGSHVPEVVCKVMEDNGHEVALNKPVALSSYVEQSWDYVITLCQEAADEVKYLPIRSNHIVHFDFEDSFKKRGLNEDEQEELVLEVYQEMDHQLYRFYRDELSEQLLPRCTCGANTYCRCE